MLLEKYASRLKWNEDTAGGSNWYDIDFSNPSQFVRYGLAEEYFVKGIEYLVSTYPYYGSWKEKHEWYLSLTLCDRYFFNNILPESNGYITFSAEGWGTQADFNGGLAEPVNKEYIKFFGGPNNPFSDFFTSNIFDESKKRTSNLKISQKNTIEFFLKRDQNPDPDATTHYECVFDLLNGTEYGDADYSRISIIVMQDTALAIPTLFVQKEYVIDTKMSQIELEELGDGFWHHYAIVISLETLAVSFKIYVDGVLRKEETVAGTTHVEVEENLIGYLGAYQGVIDPGFLQIAPGALKGTFSMDEFRFWKEERTQEEIQLFSRTCSYGGTNTDEENLDLGVYFKFNEGVVGVYARDSVVLDCSGRFSNGTWAGYTNSSRSLGSAFVDGNFSTSEEKDICVYSEHPDILLLIDEYQKIGSVYDIKNGSSFLKMLPRWIRDQNEQTSLSDLRVLSHIIGSFFDTIYILGYNLLFAKGQDYNFDGLKNIDSSISFLTSFGIKVSDIIDNVDWEEFALGCGDDGLFELSIEKIKRTILNNLSNEIVSLKKAKGTNKSIFGVLRNFGVAEDVVRVFSYDINSPVEPTENRIIKNRRKRAVDFSKEENSEATIFNSRSPESSESEIIPGISSDYDRYAISFESQHVFSDVSHLSSEMSSIFGCHSVTLSGGNYIFKVPATDFRVYLYRTIGTNNASFYLSVGSNLGNVNLNSDVFSDVLNGSHWNFCVSFYNKNDLVSGFVADPVANDCYVKFSGYRNDFGEVGDSFEIEQAINATIFQRMIENDKKVYLGADRINFTGAINGLFGYGCSKALGLRVWLSRLTEEELENHLLDVDATGIGYLNDVYAYASQDRAFYKRVLDWQFENAPEPYELAPYDYVVDRIEDYKGVYTVKTGCSDLLGKRMPAEGCFFGLPNKSDIFTDVYVYANEETGRGIISDKNGISVSPSYEADRFSRFFEPPRLKYSFEKSLIFPLNEIIYDFFGGLKYLNELFSDGEQKYSVEYYRLKDACRTFFSQINNEFLDFEKFYTYYKWIDSSVGLLLNQFVSSVMESDDDGGILKTTICNHDLCRDKYWWKREQETREKQEYEAVVIGRDSLDYTWNVGHYESGGLFEQTLWWKERANRQTSTVATGDVAVDVSREEIRKVSIGGETPNYILGSRYKIYDFSVNDSNNLQEISAEIEPYRKDNIEISENTRYDMVGNYIKNYEIVQSCGREHNNLELNKNQWDFIFDLPDSGVPRVFREDDTCFYTLVSSYTTATGFPRSFDRADTDSIFVNIFSAPGERCTGEGFRDKESLEYSSYNSMNYRNLFSKNELNKDWIVE